MRADSRRINTKMVSRIGEKDYSPEELEFLRAIDRYKRENRRPWPTWGEVLAIARSLGYRKGPDL